MLQSFTFDPYILRLDAQPLVFTSVQVNSGTVQQCYPRYALIHKPAT